MEEADPIDTQELGKARERRDISGARYLDEMQKRGSLSADFDFAKNKKELEKELLEDEELKPKVNIDANDDDNDDDDNKE